MSIPFYLISALTIAGAVAAMTLKNTLHCALALTIALAGIAFLFLGLDAQFVGFAQILVYIGAVAILVVFAVLLTRSGESLLPAKRARTWLAGLAIAAVTFLVLGWSVLASLYGLPNETAAPSVTMQQIGNALMGPYVFPLEVVAVLLTAATVGAVIVAMHEKARNK
jgi:NADH-quinone oxidoreductase subunit J